MLFKMKCNLVRIPVMRLLLWEYYRLIFCCYKWKLVKIGKGVAGLVRIKS
jgi:hypothetical protein